MISKDFTRRPQPTRGLLLFISMSLALACSGPIQDFSALNPSPPAATNDLTPPYPIIHGGSLNGEKNFAYLMNHYAIGKTEPTPWAGYWWPYTQNGIAAGAFGGGGSPAGKYDAARGNKTRSQEWEIKKHGMYVPRVQSWWGHCNGWCAASALFPEPNEPVSVNGIQFSIGDLKALLTEVGMSVNADFFGERLDSDDPNSPKYWDTVPDQFFLVLTHYIGKLKRAVLIDRYTGSQIWNQPLAGYRMEYPSPSDYLGNSAEAPQVYRILLTSTIWWLNDAVPPDVQTHPFQFETDDPSGVFQSRTLRMELWLDGPVVFDSTGRIQSSGDVVVTRTGDTISGGAWRMGEGYNVDAWPDYMWVPYSLIKPTDPDEDYMNPEVDADWITAHLLTPGGRNDPSTPAGQILPPPSSFPRGPSGLPNGFPFGMPPGLPYAPPGAGRSLPPGSSTSGLPPRLDFETF
ncbi:MAG: hypothetical protein ACO3A2_04610 [Bdellovibrionia bacterium]